LQQNRKPAASRSMGILPMGAKKNAPSERDEALSHLIVALATRPDSARTSHSAQ
jgi:hypothetical protein